VSVGRERGAIAARAAQVSRAVRHPIAQNVIGLYMIQIATFVVPLITLPYVARVLRPSAFGLVVFSQGFSFVLTTVIDWGFSYEGVRAVAVVREDPERLTTAVAEIRSGQLVLAAASVPIAAGALFVIPEFRHHPDFLVMAWVAAVATGLAPGWFFIGIEQIRLAALTMLAYRALAAVLTFILVGGPSQAWIVMALFAGSSVVTLVALDLRMYRRIARMRPATLARSFVAIRGSAALFVGTLALTLYTSLNVVLLGLFEPTGTVARFGAAERVVRVSLLVLGPVAAAVYPRLVALQSARRRERARQLLALTLAAEAVVAVTVAVVLAIAAPLVIRIVFGRPFVAESVPLLRTLVLVIPLGVISSTAGAWLMTLHMDRRIVTIVLAAGILNVALACALTPSAGPQAMAWAVVLAEATTAAGLLLTAARHPGDAPAPASDEKTVQPDLSAR
jgi:PST family polysaccharide transporter